MMFSFPASIKSIRNAVTKPNIHSLYIYIAGRQNSSDCHNKQDSKQKMVDPARVVSYEDMLRVVNQSHKMIIDVRENDEVECTGKIPSSINIPLGTVHETLVSMSHEDFRRRFNRDKPKSSDELIFYCQSGRRSSEALDLALKMGYKNSKTYSGSWSEWSRKCNDQ